MKHLRIFCLCLAISAIFSCIKVKELATLTTTEAKDISVISATSGGNITNSGGADITSRGVVWNTSTNPVITGSHTTDGSGIGSYSSSLTGLIPNTKYYIRAYAVNSVGTAYGNEVSFTTNDLVIPTLTTSAASAILLTTATAGGNISSDGGGAITARGVCWATAVNPTTADPKTSDGTGTGIFSSSLTGLIPATIYHIRAYATNSVGTAYGNDLTFTTASIAAPTVSTLDMSAVTFSSAVSGGNVTSDGGASVTVKGVCWATTAAPTTANNKTTNGNGTGAFASSLTGLAPGTLYHVRAYATNSAGTSYGNEVTFTTTPVAPATLTTTAASAVSYTTATSGGNITDAGGGTITAKGVCWSTTTSPTTANQHTSDGTGIGTFTSSITGLTPGTLYYVRAYAINSAGTAYGAEVTFTTAAIVVPTLTTTTATAISQTGATTGGNVTSDGGATVTARGVVYALTANPTLSNSVVTTGAGVGTFISNLTGLTPGATYHVRAYATNSAGTAYGSDIQFTTGVVLTPTVTTTAISAITTTTASSGGNVTADGGATVTARGVVYALTANPTLSNSVVTTGAGLGTFVSNLTGLTPGATYHVRAYATNSAGTAYGSDIQFTTGVVLTPTVTTTAISAITTTTASSGGNVTADGGATVTARGVVYALTANPTLSNSVVTTGAGLGTFVSNLTGLTPGATYHVRAYATNSAGTAYGNEVQLTTIQASYPTVTTTSITSIGTTTAVSGGNVTSDGGSNVTARGVCWGLYTDPELQYNQYSNSGTGTGVFTYTIPGLTPGTTYHVRAYATNSAGTSYGADLTFTTTGTGTLPTVTTSVISQITQTTAISGGNVTSQGSGTVTARGVCWGRYLNPELTYDLYTSDGSGSGIFISNITALTPGILYHVRAYATSSAGTAYGSDITFTAAPTLTDLDGNSYKTVQIGTQVWMAENLKTSVFNDGTNISNITDTTFWKNTTTPGYCWYDNNVINKNAYGALYNWYTIDAVSNGGKNVCPLGWHVPMQTDWNILINSLGGGSVAGEKLRETGTAHWISPNADATNESGFTALAGGLRSSALNGIWGFYNMYYNAFFWSSTESTSTSAWSMHTFFFPNSTGLEEDLKLNGFSVRCLKE